MIEKNGKKCKKKRIGFCADTFFCISNITLFILQS